MTPNNELKKLYKTVAEQIEIAKKYQQEFIKGRCSILNVKIGNHFLGNKKTISKEGKQINGIMEKYNLNIINANENKCNGKRTRQQGGERSIVDFKCY